MSLRSERRRAGSASMRCGTTTFTTPRWSRSPAAARRTTPTTGRRRRNSSRSPSGDSCIRGSGTRGRTRGAGRRPFGFAPCQFVTFLENHDQIANAPAGRGERLHERSSPGLYRALTALWLLSPGTPMFFQGQEFAASSPFVLFCGSCRRAGRRGAQRAVPKFMSQFRSAATRSLVDALPDPATRRRFSDASCATPSASGTRRPWRCHRDLLRLRRDDPVFGTAMAGSSTAPCCRIARSSCGGFRPIRRDPRSSGSSAGDRLLIVNLGADLSLRSVPEPLLAPAGGTAWELLWSSEDPAYGGMGTAPLETDDSWRIPGQAAVVLAPRRL